MTCPIRDDTGQPSLGRVGQVLRLELVRAKMHLRGVSAPAIFRFRKIG